MTGPVATPLAADGGMLGRAGGIISLAVAGIGVLLLAGAWVWLVHEGLFTYSVFTDRDLVRAFLMTDSFQVSGAEFVAPAGARVPGGALYVLWRLAQWIDSSPGFVMAFQAGLHLVAACALARVVGLRFGALNGLAMAALALGTGVVIDTNSHLWNPGMATSFVLAALAVLVAALHDRRAWLLPWAWLLVALGAQMHLSVWWLGAALVTLPLVLPEARRPPLLLACLAAVILAYAPYLALELAEGFPRTRLIVEAPPLGEPRQLASTLWASLPGWLLLGQPLDVPSRLTTLGTLAFAALPAASALAILVALARGRRALTLVLLAPALLAILAYATSPGVSDALQDQRSGRYLLVPVLCLAVAGCTGVSLARIGHRRLRRAGNAIAALLIVVFGSVGLVALREGLFVQWGASHAYWEEFFRAVRGQTGWNTAEVRDRVLRVFRTPNCPGTREWCRTLSDPFRYAAVLEGDRALNASAAGGPCAMVLRGLPASGGSAEQRFDQIMAALIGARPSLATLIRGAPLPNGDMLLVYDIHGGQCPTSFSNRFLLGPEEEATLAAFDRMEPGTSRALPHDEAVEGQSFLVSIPCARRSWRDCDPHVLAHLRLRQEAGRLIATLHANQLRGMTSVTGFYGIALLESLKLAFTDSTGRRFDLPLAQARVGAFGIHTPLRAERTALPLGRYEVRLEGTMVLDPGRLIETDAVLDRQERSVLVTPDWEPAPEPP